MMRATRVATTVAVAATTLLALAACGSGSGRASAPAAQLSAPAAGAGTSAHTPTGHDTAPVTTGEHDGQAQVAGARGRMPSEPSTGAHPGDRAGLRDASAPYVWSIKASLSPTCVAAGRTMRLLVRTAADAAVAYQAVYAGDKSGAAPPFGEGYGGNSAGYSSESDGTWSDSWLVRADAPRGPGYVTVVVASHQTTKQVDVPFTVVDPLTGTC